MDRAEARKRLEANRGAFVFKETNEALDLAIEALQEPKAEGVDFNKEWLIEEIARRDTTDGTVKVFSGREVNEIILNAPSVTPTDCDDCISREKILEHAYMREGVMSVSVDSIKLAPSVTPTVTTGEWVPVKKVYRTNDADFPNTHIEWETATCPDDVDAVRCSECGEVFDFGDARNWCAECGAKMDGDNE